MSGDNGAAVWWLAPHRPAGPGGGRRRGVRREGRSGGGKRRGEERRRREGDRRGREKRRIKSWRVEGGEKERGQG